MGEQGRVMNKKQASVTAAVVGTAVGVAGLAVLAMPAGAGTAPVLPTVSAEQLVQQVLSTKSAPALSGTVSATNNLGLPSIPGLGEASKFLSGSNTQVRVWTDGQGKGRLALPSSASEETIVFDGTTLWDWDSATNTVKKSTTDKVEHPAKPDAAKPDAAETATDPAAAAKQIIGLISKDSTVKVDGTATVAGRPVYQLVLAPKPSERTMLREVRISLDSETKLPLQLSVLANGSTTPAFQIGFSQLTIGAQDESQFQFTPPAGAKVTTVDPKQQTEKPKDLANAVKPTIVGEGWDTVIVTKLPTGTLDKTQGDKGEKNSMDPNALLKQFGKPVSGAWGSGYELSTSVGTALITTDGRVAAGAVPLQVLTSALENAK